MGYTFWENDAKNKILEGFDCTIFSKKDGFTNSFGWESFIGEKGIADTDLHPSGWIVIKDKRLFALTEDIYRKRSKCEILSVEGNRIVRETSN